MRFHKYSTNLLSRYNYYRRLLVTILFFLISPAVAVADAPRSEDPLGHRLQLSLFRYSGTDIGEPKTHFSRFKGVLRDKLTVLVEEVMGTSANNFSYLQKVVLEPQDKEAFEDKLGSEASIENYWKQSRSLLLFRGSLFSEDEKHYFAQSRLYLGELRGDLDRSSIVVQLPIQPEQFATTNDTHSLVIYYALAMDAIRLNDNPANIFGLLSKSQEKIKDLKRHPPVSADILKLEESIGQALTKLRMSSAHQ